MTIYSFEHLHIDTTFSILDDYGVANMEFKTLLVDSQFRQRGVMKELTPLVKGCQTVPWEWTGISNCLTLMAADGWEHYQSLEVTEPSVCDNYSKHGILLFFRRKKPYCSDLELQASKLP